MAVSHTITGGGLVYLSGNPIEIVLTATEALVNHKLAIKVKCSSLLSPVQIEEIEPENLVSKFNIQGLVDEPNDYVLIYPPTGTANPYDVLARNIEFEIGEVWDDANSDRQESWTVITDVLRIIDGKLNNHELALLNQQGKSFYLEYIQGGKFLTHLPQSLKVSPNQMPRLWYLSKFADNHPAVIHLKITTNQRIYTISEETTFWSITGLIEMVVNPEFWGFSATGPHPQLPGEQVLFYEFWITDAGGDISEHRYFVVDPDHHEQNFYLHYKNKFSVIENLWAHGEAKQGLKTESSTSTTPVPVGAGTMVASVKTVSQTGNRTFTLNMGVKNKPERLALRDFIESTERWIADPEDENVLIPVYLEGGEFILDNTFDDTTNIEFLLHESHLN